MKIQIRTHNLTLSQQDKEYDFHQAVKVLKEAGIKSRYVQTFTDKTDIHPGYILVD